MATATARKSTTSKTAAARPAAKKVAAKPAPTARKAAAAPAKKTVAPAVKKVGSASQKPSQPVVTDETVNADVMEELGKDIVAWIETGAFDFMWTKLLDAIDAREVVMVKIMRDEEKKAAAAKKSTVTKDDGRKVPLPTRANAKEFTPEIGTVYAVAEGHPLHGAKVKFLGYYQDNEKKAKGEVTTEIAGNPVGKKVVVPTASLKKVAARRRK